MALGDTPSFLLSGGCILDVVSVVLGSLVVITLCMAGLIIELS